MIKNAIYKTFTVLCLLLLVSCAKEKEAKVTEDATETVKSDTIQAAAESKAELNLEKFRIGKAKLGPVTVGMTVAKAETFLTEFTRQNTEAHDYGFDGGGKAFIYSYNIRPVLALVPARESDTIIAIIAIDKKLQTSLELHPKMSVKEMLPYYPNVKIHYNQMMDWENITDEVNGWSMVFMTNDKNRIGNYKKGSDKPALPKRFDARMSWITITKPNTKTDCSLLREGKFTYKDSEGEDVVVKVNDNVWTEEHKGGKYITMAQMKWLSKCEYENTLIMSSLPGFKLPPGTKMDVTLDKVTGFDIYFTATADGKSYHGKLTKI